MNRALICFTRVPRPGVTKTRLLPVLSGVQCAGLHTAFLKDLSNVYRQVDADLFVAYTADPDWEKLKEIFTSAKAFFPQDGTDLGEKMHRALCRVLAMDYDAVVLTGADLPLMAASHPESGFAALEKNDVVLGPTSDGGYYLVGTKKPCGAIFEKQQYVGSSVLENTIEAGNQAGLDVALALPCDDVDTPEDLRMLPCRLSPESSTYQYLLQLKKEGVPL